MSKLIINIGADNKIDVQIKGKVTVPDVLQACLTTCLASMHQVVDAAPPEHQQTIKENLYDKFNFGASRLLEQFAPELELRPGLTAQAIKEAEDRIILEGRLNEVEPNS